MNPFFSCTFRLCQLWTHTFVNTWVQTFHHCRRDKHCYQTVAITSLHSHFLCLKLWREWDRKAGRGRGKEEQKHKWSSVLESWLTDYFMDNFRLGAANWLLRFVSCWATASSCFSIPLKLPKMSIQGLVKARLKASLWQVTLKIHPQESEIL